MSITCETVDTSFTETFREPCRKCRGQGRFIGYTGRVFGQCFTCKGKGYFERRTSPEARANARASRERRTARDRQTMCETFAAANPAIWAWIEESAAGFEFAGAMREAVAKYGELTEKQLAACQKCIDARAASAAERQSRVENAPAVETDKLMAAFDKALSAGLKRPKMRFDGFVASLAPATSRNAGAVYLKDRNGEYLGKIQDGKLLARRECGEERAAAIRAAMADPMASAVAYGRRTGACSCCGRELTDPASVAAGIGPVCAEKFGL